MRKILVARHGQTDFNARGLIQGSLDIPLNDIGEAQASAIKLALEHEDIDLIISSPLARARQTVAELALTKGLEVQLEPLIRERSFGEFEGISRDYFYRTLDEYDGDFWAFRPKGGESVEDVSVRAQEVCDKLLTRSERCILLAGHAGINRSLIQCLLRLPLNQWRSVEQSNACLNEFVFTEDGELSSYQVNMLGHLPS